MSEMGPITSLSPSADHLPAFPGNAGMICRLAGMSQRCHQETYAPQQSAAHSITSSAPASSEDGTVRPSALATADRDSRQRYDSDTTVGVGPVVSPSGPDSAAAW